MSKISTGWKIFIGLFAAVAIYFGGAYLLKWPPFQKKVPASANNSTGGGSGSGGGAGGGLFDGTGDGITYASLVAPSTILRKGIKDPAVIRLKKLINIVRSSLGQNPVPENDYFGQVCEEALQWSTSATGKGVDGQSIKEITIQTIDAEETSKNLFKPKG